jgi:hypothetical protein
MEGAIANCVGVVDGYLLRIKTPTREEVGNVRSYFSGHYQCNGLNVQAVADYKSRFLFIAIAGPGSMSDRYAIRETSLWEKISNLPAGYCIIGDNAYQATEHLVPIYGGADRLEAKYDNFNFFASQCWIRVEMAFGMMQTKFGILCSPLQCRLKNVRWLMLAVAKLHNYCINERDSDDPMESNSNKRCYLTTQSLQIASEDNNEHPNGFVDALIETDGHSHLRESMVERVRMMKLERPLQNRIIH